MSRHSSSYTKEQREAIREAREAINGIWPAKHMYHWKLADINKAAAFHEAVTELFRENIFSAEEINKRAQELYDQNYKNIDLSS